MTVTDLAGTGFQPGATVNLSLAGYPDIAATSVTVVSDSQITCTLPITGASIGDWDVTVRNPDTGTGTLFAGFTITAPPPTVSSITPSSGLNTGDVTVTNLAGTGFQSGATVTLSLLGEPDIGAN